MAGCQANGEAPATRKIKRRRRALVRGADREVGPIAQRVYKVHN